MEEIAQQTTPQHPLDPDYPQQRDVPESATNGGPSRGLFVLVGLILVVLFAAAIAYGIRDRSRHEQQLTVATDAEAIPTVNTTYPSGGAVAADLVLPGNVQAFIETPIYARTNGYLKKWYYDIGAHVKKGALLATIETPEVDQQLEQSKAELERIQANAALAGVTSDRWQALLAKHAVSQQEADQNKSNYIAAEAAVDSSRANVRRLEELQGYERIVAPFDGTITARNTDLGDLITAGTSNPRELFHLASMGTLRVFVPVPEIYADKIQNGEPVTLTQDSHPGEAIPGKVVRNSNAINTTTRTLNVEVEVNNSTGRLLPGTYIFVHFKLPPGTHVVTIPSNALLFRAEGLQVGVVHGSRVELRRITIGHDYGNTVEVTSGVDTHDQIILDPSDSLTANAVVHPSLVTAKGAR